jgi:NAD(P)-dependent dehydrogenase (short-subunit alcohol dehydrogenase family)
MQGHVVGLMARSGDALRTVADGIRSRGGTACVLPADITDPAAVSSAVDQLTQLHGPVEALVNNAGMVHPIARVSELSPSDFERTVAVNLHGAFHCIHAVLPAMLQAGRGTVIQVSSGAAHQPLEGWMSYCVGKAGLWMMTQSLALEVRSSGVAVYGFQPGTIDTDMQARIRASGINPVSRMARTDHLPPRVPADCIAWLLRHRPADWHGEDLRVDGVRRRMDAEGYSRSS